MSRHQGRYPSRGGSSRRLTEWLGGPQTTSVQAVTASGNTIVDTGTEFLQKLTLVRIRGEIALWIVSATAAFDGFTSLSLGIGIASQDAFAAGAASLPSPNGDPDWGGWIWYHRMGALVSPTTTEVATGPMDAVRVPIDTKAMRKVGPNDTIFGAVATVTEIGTVTVNFVMNTRMLIKLS